MLFQKIYLDLWAIKDLISANTSLVTSKHNRQEIYSFLTNFFYLPFTWRASNETISSSLAEIVKGHQLNHPLRPRFPQGVPIRGEWGHLRGHEMTMAMKNF